VDKETAEYIVSQECEIKRLQTLTEKHRHDPAADLSADELHELFVLRGKEIERLQAIVDRLGALEKMMINDRKWAVYCQACTLGGERHCTRDEFAAESKEPAHAAQ